MALPAFFCLFLLFESLFVVKQVQQAIVVQFGQVVSKKVLKPGLYFKVPFIQNVIYLDRRILDLNSDLIEVIAADQKRLIVNAYTKYRITDPLKFFQTARTEAGMNRRLRPIIESNLREQVGRVSLICLLSDCRSEVMHKIQSNAHLQAKPFGVEIVDVRIMRTDLPEANSDAIFRRMQTDRAKEAKEIRAQGAGEAQRVRSNAEKEKRVILAEAERQSKITKGEAEAKAITIFAEAFGRDKPFFEFYRYMQTYKSAFSASDTAVLLSPDNFFLRYMYNSEKFSN